MSLRVRRRSPCTPSARRLAWESPADRSPRRRRPVAPPPPAAPRKFHRLSPPIAPPRLSPVRIREPRHGLVGRARFPSPDRETPLDSPDLTDYKPATFGKRARARVSRPVAWVAQLVEQRIENPRVGGSNPSPGTTSLPRNRGDDDRTLPLPRGRFGARSLRHVDRRSHRRTRLMQFGGSEFHERHGPAGRRPVGHAFTRRRRSDAAPRRAGSRRRDRSLRGRCVRGRCG